MQRSNQIDLEQHAWEYSLYILLSEEPVSYVKQDLADSGCSLEGALCRLSGGWMGWRDGVGFTWEGPEAAVCRRQNVIMGKEGLKDACHQQVTQCTDIYLLFSH